MYVELKANYGSDWGLRIPTVAGRRAAREVKDAHYMPTADAHHALAYLDVGPLFDLVEQEWQPRRDSNPRYRLERPAS